MKNYIFSFLMVLGAFTALCSTAQAIPIDGKPNLTGSANSSDTADASSAHEYMLALEKFSPLAANSLRSLEQDYRKKCATFPGKAQYQYLAQTEAFNFHRAHVAFLNENLVENWPESSQTQYAAILEGLACLKLASSQPHQ